MQQRLQTISGRIERRFQGTRRGTVLIMVVALLVLLALMGTAFIATARMDRLSAGQVKQLTSWQEIADSLAQQALSIAGTWIAGDPQTFTSGEVDGSSTSNGGIYIASRDPVIWGATGISTDPLMGYAATAVDKMLTTGPGNQAVIAWPHITQPLGYNYFISPVVQPTASTNTLPTGWPTGEANNTFELGPLKYKMIPTNIVVSYPATYTNSDLAGRTWTFPAFYRLTEPSQTGATTPAPYYSNPASWQVDGPFLAADATGWGIADSALVPLNIPPTQGISWFAAWRIVDNAAAVDLNTAFGPAGDEDNFPGAVDGVKNCLNYFPSDVNLEGMLAAQFSTGPLGSQPPEFAAINARRYQIYATGSSLNNTSGYDDSGAQHTDMVYSNDCEAIWTNLGRRVDFPAAFAPSTATANDPGDPLKSHGRPFDVTESGALGYRGVMVQSDGPVGKIEQIGADNTKNPTGDSIYRSAVNYMNNSDSYFKFFEPNQVAYWYDWYFNYDYPYDWTAGLHSSNSLPVFNGPQTVPGLSTLTIGNRLGNDADTVNPYPFRTPRADVTANNKVMNQVRMVDQAVVATFAAGSVATGPNVSIIPPLTSGINHKASLNTALFGELWRAYINVLTDLPAEDGANPPLAAYRESSGYYLLNVPGGISDTANATIKCNPVQFRSCMRDPSQGSTASITTAGVTSCAQNASLQAIPGKTMLALRAALGAANIMTLRDQHGLPVGSNFFMPRSIMRQITLKTPAPDGNGAAYNANVYGVGAQPYIAEVYVSTANIMQTDPTSNATGQNPEGLVVIKLYNPYPYAISLANYAIAMVNRGQFSAATGMTVQLMDTSAAIPSFATTSMAPFSYLIISSYKSGGFWPSYLSAAPPTVPPLAPPPPATPGNSIYMEVDNLVQLIGGTGTGAPPAQQTSYEMLLLGPTNPNAALPGVTVNGVNDQTPQLPIDSFDFTGYPGESQLEVCVSGRLLRNDDHNAPAELHRGGDVARLGAAALCVRYGELGCRTARAVGHGCTARRHAP
jgi:Tfp pilus assembly protein PilX